MSRSPTEEVTSLLLFARFAAVEEPRRHAHKIVFSLELLLLIVFGAALCDMPGWQGAADFARLKQGWLRGLCPWEGEGTRTADTLERLRRRPRRAGSQPRRPSTWRWTARVCRGR